MTKNRIGAVDGLRAIAMTAVVLEHCKLLAFGWMGVWLFYMISGFVVCGTFHREAQRDPGNPWKVLGDFFARRALRIWPVYFLYIALTLLFFVFAGIAFFPGDVATLFGFVYNWQMIFRFAGPTADWAGFGHLWTISVEQQFYIVFPLIYFIALASRARPGVLIALLLLAPVIRYLLGAAVLASSHNEEAAAFAVYASSIGHFDAFLLGAIIGRYSEHIAKSRHIEGLSWAGALATSVAYVAIQVSINMFVEKRSGVEIVTDIVSGILHGHLREVFVYYVPVLMAGALLVSIIKGRFFVRILEFPALRWVGEISYGCYVLHLAALIFWSWLLGGVVGASVIHRILLFAVTYASTLFMAWLSYRYFETWFHRFRPRRRAATPAAP